MAYKNPEDAKAWHARNRPRKLKYMAEYRKRNATKVNASQRAWREKNQERKKAYDREYGKTNLPRRRVYKRAWMARQMETNLNYRIRGRLTTRVRLALKRNATSKSVKTIELLGCSIDFLRGYLEARFVEGMSWANIGKWHIDHVIPCAEFDLRDPIQQRQCFHYSNLKPLWSAHNLAKGAKPPGVHQAELL